MHVDLRTSYSTTPSFHASVLRRQALILDCWFLKDDGRRGPGLLPGKDLDSGDSGSTSVEGG